jgi:hypothetical protein
MSLSLYSTSGWIGPLASTGGWADVRKAVGGEPSELGAFVKNGFSDSAPRLRSDTQEFLEKHQGAAEDVRETLSGLDELLEGIEDTVIVSESLLEDSDDES